MAHSQLHENSIRGEKYRIGVLTISDTSSRDPSSDKSGPIVAQTFQEHPSGSFEISEKRVVGDDVELIQAVIREWVDRKDGVDAVICTGGTGFGNRDVTPEALSPLIDKQSSGLTYALIDYSLSKTPLASLSRLVTGIRTRRENSSSLSSSSSSSTNGSTLLVALPGSAKAVRECCEVLLGTETRVGVLGHALELLQGGTGAVQHAAMQGDTKGDERSGIKGTETDTGRSRSHSHHQHHHHHHGLHSHNVPKPRTSQLADTNYRTQDPTLPASTRHRSSPYPIISMDEALSLIDQHTPDRGSRSPVTLPITENLEGHILAQDVIAKRDLPPGPTTNVDGYAVDATKAPAGTYQVRTKVSFQEPLRTGQIFRINTGQALPPGTNAVVMVEDTRLAATTSNGEEEKVELLAQVDVGENVRKAGSDVKQGQVVLREGMRVSELGGEVGTLAFLGYTKVQIYPKPIVAILSTGNELYDATNAASQSKVEEDVWGFRVFDANRPGLSTALKGAGFHVVDLGIVGDNVESTLSSLNRGLEEADVIITTGGTSMGESDLLKPLIERNIRGGAIHFGRVAMKPGKPTTFATANALQLNVSHRIIFALPGNPASALVCFYVFVMPALRKLAGLAATKERGYSLPRVRVKIDDEMKLDPRPEFHRVVIRSTSDGSLIASSTGSQRSSGMHSMASANGLVCVPSLQEGGPTKLERGSLVDAIILGPLI